MKRGLKDKSYHGVYWSAIDTMGVNLAQFVIGIILARLLEPEQFGLIGMISIFMALAASFLESGFASALIQKKDVNIVDTSSVFYFNIIIGLSLTGVLYLAAPLIAAFYKQPILTPLTRAVSLIIVINSFSVVQTAILNRQINFKTLAKVNLIAALGSGIIGITMAYSGFGVWSLVAQQIGAALFRAMFLWFLNSWRPSLDFSFHSLRFMFSFGSRLLASGLLHQVFNNIYLLIIGKFYSPTTLGFYTRAKRFIDLPTSSFTNIVAKVSFPVFSSVQDDEVLLKKGLRKALCSVVFLTFPAMIGLAAISTPLVKVLLTEKWLPCVPYINVLFIVGMFLPLHSLNLNVIKAKGRSELFFRLEIIKKVLITANIALTYRWGIMAMLTGQIVVSALSYYINNYYIAKLINYSAIDQLRDVSMYFFCSALMGGVIYSFQYVPFSSDVLLLLTQVVCGGVLYMILCRIFRLSAFFETYEILRSKLTVFCR